VIDVDKGEVSMTIPMPSGGGAAQPAVTPNGKYLFVPIQGYTSYGNTVVIVDTATDSVIGQPITVGNYPDWISITPNGKYAYVSNGIDNTVSVIDVKAALAGK
jgi:DNA-binding beta-propeller fold protein YncE